MRERVAPISPAALLSDDKLPPAIAARMASVQARRIAGGMIARDGASCASVEAREWRDDLLAWHDAGRPAEHLPELKRRRAALRAAGHNV